MCGCSSPSRCLPPTLVGWVRGRVRAAVGAQVELDLDSYDRLFPSQDLASRDSFGNLIALPLQAAAMRDGNSVFLDPETLEPVADQWRLPGRVDRITRPCWPPPCGRWHRCAPAPRR